MKFSYDYRSDIIIRAVCLITGYYYWSSFESYLFCLIVLYTIHDNIYILFSFVQHSIYRMFSSSSHVIYTHALTVISNVLFTVYILFSFDFPDLKLHLILFLPLNQVTKWRVNLLSVFLRLFLCCSQHFIQLWACNNV